MAACGRGRSSGEDDPGIGAGEAVFERLKGVQRCRVELLEQRDDLVGELLPVQTASCCARASTRMARGVGIIRSWAMLGRSVRRIFASMRASAASDFAPETNAWTGNARPRAD